MTSTETMEPGIKQSSFKLTGSYGDWRDELQSEGVVVIKNVMSASKAAYYQQKALDWLQSFGTALDYNDPSTWIDENFPVQGKVNNFTGYCVSHEKFMWDARMEPKVLEAFAKVWGTDELLVSFDALNITLPNRKDKPAPKPWPHVDQSPFRRGLHCVQGIINLSQAGPEDGSLIVLPKSSTLSDEFFDTQVDPSTWLEKDFRFFSEEEMQWYAARGNKPKKVLADPGDLILWDSRTVHWGGEPTPKSDTIRTVIYASYSPVSLATAETLERKKEAIESFRATTHWPHDNIVLRDKILYLPDGTADPRNRSKPLEEPDYTDQLLRLAGVKPKRKCDGERPKCGFCASAGAECEYQENSTDKSEADQTQEILQRLEQLENLVRQQSTLISALSDRVLSSNASPDTSSSHSQTPSHINSTASFVASPVYTSFAREIPPSVDVRLRYDNEDGPLLIPLGHQTPTGNLLTLDKIKRLIGEYPQDYFLFLESERELQPLTPRVSYAALIDKLNQHREIADFLVSSFFNNIHSQFPILEQKTFLATFEKFLRPNQKPDMSAALCLMTLALGEICTNPSATFDIESSEFGNGTDYFAHGYQILTTVETAPFSRDLAVPLGFFYASLYFRYRSRPLQAWRSIHSASTSVQLMLSYLQDRAILPEKHILLVRIAWACYVLECDDLAEFHFPRSGIEVLVDDLPFPEFTDSDDRNNLKFLAMCSIRKLLNRIHSTMYASKSTESNGSTSARRFGRSVKAYNQQPSIASLESVNIELSRQLRVWFESLPDTIKPDLQNPNARDLHDSQLRTRYYATKHVICRPCLVFAAQSEQTQLSGLLAAVFVISMAKDTPTLASLVPDFDELIEQAILCTEPWARHHDTADAILGIFKTIRQKLRFPSHEISR
ncbi:transcriptional regulator family: Fungal Specific TF [Penicillium malachiteum]|nr:transcriptional regulator family: Fungal Specific TF [Penicillium malachiteum]